LRLAHETYLPSDRCLREIRAVAALPRHDNIVAQYRAWQESGHFYIQMDYCEGGSLHQLIVQASKSGRTLDYDQIVKVALDVAAGLDFLHSHGVLHLDIKPENIYRSRLGPWRIGDFGLAVAKEATDWEEGDGDYVPPELLRSNAEPTTAADIFSLGATLYECATGHKVPRKEGSPEAAPPVVQPHRPAAFQHLLQWMLQPNPAARPTAAQVLEALQQQPAASPAAATGEQTSPSAEQVTPLGAAGDSSHTFTFDLAVNPDAGSVKLATIPLLAFGVLPPKDQGKDHAQRIVFSGPASEGPVRWAPSLSPLVSEGALTPGAAAGLIGLTPPTAPNEETGVAQPQVQQQQTQQLQARRPPPLQLPLHCLSTGINTARTAGSNSFRLHRRDLVSPGSDFHGGSASESEGYTFSCGTGGSASDLDFVDILSPVSPGWCCLYWIRVYGILPILIQYGKA
jgi:serine/threonine protein kinase